MNSAFQELTLEAQSKEVAKSFLQSVVLLDDLVDMPTSPVSSKPVEDPQGIHIPLYPERTSRSEPVLRERFEVRLNATQVIDAFAQIGAVCAVLSPGLDDTYRNRVYMTALRADIVILDWKLNESNGGAALEIMSNILKGDTDAQRLRLIAIYTGEPDLNSISNRVEGALNDVYGDNDVQIVDRYHMVKKALRVVILAKPDTLNDQTRVPGAEEVAEHRLAEKLLEEFSKMTAGLLPNVALAGVAAIRSNAHRMVAQFSQDLDAAYLGHRMLLPHPPDSEDHLLRALGAEVLSILEAANPGVHANADAIDLWLDGTDEQLLSEPFSFNGHRDPVQEWRELLKQGIEAGSSHLPKGGKKLVIRTGTEAFAADPTTAALANRRFAALLNLKTRYVQHAPRLMIGSLVQIEKQTPEQYLLCLLPKCDSVRLATPTRVPFVPLQVRSEQSGNGSLRFVLQTSEGTWVHLDLSPKPSELVVAAFQPGPNPPGEIIAVRDSNGEFIFECEDTRRYRWMAALKDEHAFGIAAEVAAALARPGPDDAEWLRQS